MKNAKINIIVVCLFFFINVDISLAQNNFSLSTKSLLNDLRECKDDNGVYKPAKALKDKYALFEKNGVLYVSGLAQISDNSVIEVLKGQNCIISTQINDIIAIRVPLSVLDVLKDVKGIKYIELGRKIKPDLKDALIDTRADSVHAGIFLPQTYSGKGVIIGVTDWGFDYTHPTFYDTSQSNLRIVRAWDQYKNSGPAPSGLTYGTEFSTQQELLAAEHDTSNIYGLNTHGTHTSAIAAGSGAGTPYRGFAYESELVMVTILVDEASVLDAFNYIYNYANSVGKPVVVNMSWGLYYMGTLDGTSLLSQSLDYLTDMGVTFVASAGNNGNVNFHIKKQFTQPNDTLRTFIDFEPYSLIPTMWGQSVTIWGSPNTPFEYGLEIYDNTNNIIQDLPIYNTINDLLLDSNVIIGSDTIEYKIESEAVNLYNQRPGVRLRVRNLKTSTYKIGLKVISDTGIVHLWNIIELVNDVGNWGAAFTNPLPNTTAGDDSYGIGEPACASSVISVGSYRSQIKLPNGNLSFGNISSYSSKGPLISEAIKPDITAPGENVASAVSSFYNGATISTVTNVTFNGKIYKFGRLSGTSMSSPATAGIAALLLEIKPSLTPIEIKNLIKQSARLDNYTGIIPPSGDVKWGWGKINAYKAATIAADVANIYSFSKGDYLKFMPNPSNGIIDIDGLKEGYYDITVLDMSGKIVYESQRLFMTRHYKINLMMLKKGIYLMQLQSPENKYSLKLILQ